MEILTQKNDNLPKGFNGTVVNRTLPSFHAGSLENTLTVPLNIPNS